MKHSEDIGPSTTPIFLPNTTPATIPADTPYTSQQKGPRLPIKIMDWYLFTQVAQATVRGLGWFAGLLFVVAIITAVRKLVDTSLTIPNLGEWLIYQVPRILLFTLPMSVLYGCVQAIIDLSAHGEVTAMLAGGMNLRRMLVAPLAWGSLMAVLAFVLQEQAMPACERQKEDAVRRSVAHSKVQEHFRYEDPPTGRGALKRIIQSDSFDPKTGTLVKPRIQEYDEDHRVSKEVAADRAVWNRTTGEWDFYTGEVIYHPRKNKSDFIRGATFEHLRYKAPNPTKLGSATMTLRQHLDHGDFEMVSMSDLVAYREIVRQEARQTHNPDDLKAKQQSIKSVTFGIHDKISTPLICIALVLVGVPLGIRPQRSASSGLAMGLSLIVLLLYYTAYSWTQTVGGAGQGNPALMAYASLVLTVVVGSVLVWWKDH